MTLFNQYAEAALAKNPDLQLHSGGTYEGIYGHELCFTEGDTYLVYTLHETKLVRTRPVLLKANPAVEYTVWEQEEGLEWKKNKDCPFWSFDVHLSNPVTREGIDQL
jgi:hypothetical protein